MREIFRLHPAQHDIGVGDGEWTALTVARRARMSARRIRSDPKPRAIKIQDRAAACRNSMNLHDWRAHPDAGNLGIKGTLKLTGIMGDIGRGATHVKADNFTKARHRRRADGTNNAACRTGKNTVFTAKPSGIGEPAIGLHEHELGITQLARHLSNIVCKDR